MRTETPPRILLTGPPGCGKTTVVLRIMERFAGPANGFYTREVRRRGGRIGFDVVTLGGNRGPLARKGAPGPRVGRYGVDLASFEALGVAALERALADPFTLLVVDELGKMEFLSERFVALLPRLFTAPNPLLATVLVRQHPVADRYRHAFGVEVIDVTRRNRDALPGRLAGRFSG